MNEVLEVGHRLPVVVGHGQLLALVLHSVDPSFGFRGWESMRIPDVFRLWGTPSHLRAERWP